MSEQKSELVQGTLDMLILKILSTDSEHGYGIARQIERLTDDVLRVEEGSLYPALHRMEKRGWLVAEWGLSENNRRAKFYGLTAAGRRQLDSQASTWDRVSEAIQKVMKPA